MKKNTAKFISFLFHPVIFATLAPFLVIYHTTKNIIYGFEWTAFSFLFVLAVLFVLYIVRPKDFFKDFDISKKEKRPLFYSISFFFAVLYFGIAVFIKSIFFPLSVVSLGIIMGIVIFEFINNYIKISVHAAVSSAFAITIALLYGFFPFIFVFWIPFSVSWSRFILKKHTKQEIVSGLAVGCMITLLTFAIAELFV